MSKTRPECPLYNHNSCKDAYIPKVCALVRQDKTCLKKQLKKVATNNQSRPNCISLNPVGTF